VAPLAIGTNTDPGLPFGAEHGLMRQIRVVLSDHDHPVRITTRCTLIERDTDLIA